MPEVVEAQSFSGVLGDVGDCLLLGQDVLALFGGGLGRPGADEPFPGRCDRAEEAGAHERGAPDSGAEGVAAHQVAATDGEDLAEWTGREGVPVCGEQLDREAGQRDLPSSCPGLGIGLDRDVPVDLDCDAEHPDGTGIEVDGIPSKPGALAPPQPRSGGQGDDGTVPVGDVPKEHGELLPRDDAVIVVLAAAPGQAYALTWVRADQSIPYGRAHHSGQQTMAFDHGRGREAAGLRAGHQRWRAGRIRARGTRQAAQAAS